MHSLLRGGFLRIHLQALRLIPSFGGWFGQAQDERSLPRPQGPEAALPQSGAWKRGSQRPILRLRWRVVRHRGQCALDLRP